MNIALQEKIENKNALIAIVGLGYVGLPLMLRYAAMGYRVLGIDVDQEKVDALKSGQSYIKHISSDVIKEHLSLLSLTTDFSQSVEADALILCVPTPLTKYREPDLSYVMTTVNALSPFFREGQVLSLESTTYPGTTDEELKPLIEQKGFTVGTDFFLLYSPEREDPGNKQFVTESIPKVCGGVTPNCLAVGLALYGAIIERVVPVSSTRVAEMTKLLENIHRSVNIGLVNEMKVLTDKMGIDIFEVIDAAATKPFGFVPYYPGPGIGGHCIPIDPFYLTWKAREYGMHTRFIELAGEINANMPNWVVHKLFVALNECSKSIKGSRVLVLGVAYKKNVDDMRESPSLVLIERLKEKGAMVDFSDPHVPELKKVREHDLNMQSVPLNEDIYSGYDAVILATAHDAFDYESIQKNAPLVIDTRGAFRHYKNKNIVQA
jgi:UDP-N-acetyl-D-glucosamine dehydrogenase